jgi:signal transduction histidine kinase
MALKRDEAVKKRLLEHTVSAREEERLHLSRELHDDTAQRLTSLLIGLDALRRKTTQKDHLTRIQELVRQAEATMSEVRRLAQGLRPALLEELGLKVAMEQLAEEGEKNGGPKVRVHVTPMCGRFPGPGWRSSASCEAINNVRGRGAGGGTRPVARTRSSSDRDNGVGFDFIGHRHVARVRGLRLVVSRAPQAIGGRLEVETSPGRGTALSIGPVDAGVAGK